MFCDFIGTIKAVVAYLELLYFFQTHNDTIRRIVVDIECECWCVGVHLLLFLCTNFVFLWQPSYTCTTFFFVIFKPYNLVKVVYILNNPSQITECRPWSELTW